MKNIEMNETFATIVIIFVVLILCLVFLGIPAPKQNTDNEDKKTEEINKEIVRKIDVKRPPRITIAIGACNSFPA